METPGILVYLAGLFNGHQTKPLKELQADGHGQLRRLAGRFETASLRVDAEDDDVIAALIRNEQKPAGRVDDEVSGPIAFGRNVFDECWFAGCLVEREHDDAVVTAV